MTDIKSRIKIVDLGIANFRSFDQDGVVIKDFGKTNLFIGKNNSGKSNVLRFIKLLSKLVISPQYANDLENQFRGNGKNAELIVSIEKDSFFNGIHIEPTQIWDEKLTFRIDLGTRKLTNISLFDQLNRHQLHKLQTKFSEQHNVSELTEQVKIEFLQNLFQSLAHFKNLIYVPDFREIKESGSNTEGIQNVNGDNVISVLHEMQHPRRGNEKAREKFEKIESLVGELLGIKDFAIEIPFDKSELLIKMYGNRLALESFGSGVHELVILCSALAIYDEHTVCIEEPEIHLHPELQRKLLEFTSRTNNRYFLTTHSNVLLDSFDGLKIYHVTHDGEASKIVKADTDIKTVEILNDLAYKASDILQSNGIIWVEGPSDRAYLMKWLSLVEPSFIEGIHYSIMFYGGRLLSHISMKSDYFEQELIPLLRINRNVIVVIDRDGFSSESKLNKTKMRINSETSKGNCWITKGREIENYLTQRTIESYISTKFGFNIHFNHNSDRRIGDTLKRGRSSKKLLDYDKNKPKYAKEIVDFITQEDLEILDLKKKVNQLVRSIHKWNYTSAPP